MDTSLASAINAAMEAGHAVDALQQKITKVDVDLERVKSDYTHAEHEYRQLNAALALDEAKPADVAKAKKSYEELLERRQALTDALAVLVERMKTARAEHDARKDQARNAAREAAAPLAAAQLEKLQELATRFAVAMATWSDLDSAAQGGRMTGLTQQRRHGCVEILSAHGFRGLETMQIGSPNGHEPIPTPERILRLARGE